MAAEQVTERRSRLTGKPGRFEVAKMVGIPQRADGTYELPALKPVRRKVGLSQITCD